MVDYQTNPETFQSQKSQVREHLLEGRHLTALQALHLYGSLRLSAIIFDLRDEGLLIETDIIKVAPRKRVADYYIKPENLSK